MAAPALSNFASGVGAVTADNLNTFILGGVFPSQLRLFPGAWNGQIVYLGGYTSTGDGGQGMFSWNSTSTAKDNAGVSVIVPFGTVGYGAWIRLFGSAGSLRVAGTGGTDVMAPSDNTIVWNYAFAGIKTQTLLAANTVGLNYTVTVKDGFGDSYTNPIKITPVSGKIDGAASITLNVNFGSLTFAAQPSTNTWWVI